MLLIDYLNIYSDDDKSTKALILMKYQWIRDVRIEEDVIC